MDKMKLETSLTSEQVEQLIRDHVAQSLGRSATTVVSVKPQIGRNLPDDGGGFVIRTWAVEVELPIPASA